jgi:hypothetical protein
MLPPGDRLELVGVLLLAGQVVALLGGPAGSGRLARSIAPLLRAGLAPAHLRVAPHLLASDAAAAKLQPGSRTTIVMRARHSRGSHGLAGRVARADHDHVVVGALRAPPEVAEEAARVPLPRPPRQPVVVDRRLRRRPGAFAIPPLHALTFTAAQRCR